MKKKPQIFNRIQAQGVPVSPKFLKVLSLRKSVSEVFDKPQPTSTKPKTMTRKNRKEGGVTEFEVDGQSFSIRIRPKGWPQLKLVNIGFERLFTPGPDVVSKKNMYLYPSGATHDKTGQSVKQVFKVMATVVSWTTKWIDKNQEHAKTYLVAHSVQKPQEAARGKLYEFIVKKIAIKNNLEYMIRHNVRGTHKYLVVFDPVYLRENPKYHAMLHHAFETFLDDGFYGKYLPPKSKSIGDRMAAMGKRIKKRFLEEDDETST